MGAAYHEHHRHRACIIEDKEKIPVKEGIEKDLLIW
jgi:hypothetical protein